MKLIEILAILSLALFLGIFIFKIFYHFLKPRPFYSYVDDEFIKEKESISATDKLFFTHGETRKYISRYALSTGDHEKYVICNYNSVYKGISFFVVCYNKKKKIIGVYNYLENNPKTNISKIIPINGKTDSVNIIIGKVDDVLINRDVYQPIRGYKIFLYSILSAFEIFFLLNGLVYFIAKFICMEYIYSFIFTGFYYILLGVAGFIAFLYFIITLFRLNRRNAKSINGGVVEYEFV